LPSATSTIRSPSQIRPWPIRSGTRPLSRCVHTSPCIARWKRRLNRPPRGSPAWRRASCCGRLAPERAARPHDRRDICARGAAHGAQPLRRERGPTAGARGDPFSNSPASEDAKGRYDTENKKLEAEIDRRSKALERRLLADVPALKPHLGQRKVGELPAFPYDGDLAQGKIILSDQMEGLWRWQVDGSPLWLMQLLVIEGSGAFGQGPSSCSKARKRPPAA